MSKPPNIVRPTRLNLHLPADLRGWLDVHLWSESEMRVPHGAYQKLITKLLLDYKKSIEDRGLTEKFIPSENVDAPHA